MMFKIPDPAEQLEQAKRTIDLIREAAGQDHPERFCPVSLGDWLELCGEAGVPHVPAELVATMLRDDCLAFDTRGEHQERLVSALEALQEAKLENHMMRMDPASGIEIKHRLSIGEPEFRPEFQEIILDDPRLFDILFEYPREEVPVWRRPWVDAMRHQGYPVEYRAFVRDSTLLGISNYYPQRPLPEFPAHLEAVRRYTQALIESVKPPFLWHTAHGLMDGTLDAAGIHFTADFLVTVQDEVLFLEGGPPHELGAHPCCFEPGNIQGIELRDRN